jgi:flagellar basal body-associated protein FliL
MSDAENNEVEEVEEESSGPGKLVILLTAVNTLICLGIAGFLYLNFQKHQTTPQAEDMVTEGDAHAESGGGGHGESKDGDHGKSGGCTRW